MKALCLLAVLSAAFSFPVFSSAQDLDVLWKQYDAAAKADRPKDELEVLSSIRKQAARSRSTWDYYRACEKYSYVRARVNWKDREAAGRQFRQEIEDYDDPVATFFLLSADKPCDTLLQYVKSRNPILIQGHNTGFYSNDRNISGLSFSEALLPLLENDWEYALWSLYAGWHKADEAVELLGTQGYPKGAFLEYLSISRKNDNTGELEKFAERYSGKAVSLLARSDLLNDRFCKLLQKKGASQDDYLKLRDDCLQFVKEQKSFRDDEKTTARCCKRPEQIVNELEDKGIMSFEGDFDHIVLGLRNLDEVEVRLTLDGKTALSAKLSNPERSFYVTDTVRLDLPDMDDGRYYVECSSGDRKSSFEYKRCSLSLSLRKDSEAYGCYVADSRSGKPQCGCSIMVSGKIAGTTGEDGFAVLSGPESFTCQARMAGPVTRLSPEVRSHDWLRNAKSDKTALSASILLDRKAFNPSDTVHFKAIVWQDRRVVEGCTLEAVLKDAKGETVSSCILETGEFGSAAGAFALEGGERNGTWSISIRSGGMQIASSSFRVDEFVLPTFNVDWDRQERLWFAGERVTVTGLLKSYSGHSIDGSRMIFTVDGEPADDFAISGDGRFTLSFKSSDDNEYNTCYGVSLKVTDATGETHEFSTSVRVAYRIPLHVELVNRVKGEVCPKEHNLGVTDSDEAHLSVNFGALKRSGISVNYTISKGDRIYGSGSTGGGEEVTVSLSGAPDGVYTLKAVASEGEKKEEYEGNFVKAVRSAGDVPFLYRYSGDDAVAVGVSGSPAWVLAEFFNDSAQLLARRVFRIDPGASLKEIRFPCSCNGTLHLLSFRDGQKYYISRDIIVSPEDSAVPLHFTRFLDTTCPGGRYSFSLKTAPDTECCAAVFDAATETVASNVWRGFRAHSGKVYVSYWSEEGFAKAFTRHIRGLNSLKASAADSSELLVEEEAIPFHLVSDSSRDAVVRSNFSTYAAFLPFLRSDSEGNVDFSFTNSDRLSTCVVQLFAHDKTMRSAALRKKMLVTLPVKVSMVPPRFLHEGDSCVLSMTVSNSGKEDISGEACIELYDGQGRSDLITAHKDTLTVPSGGSAAFTMPFDAPKGIQTLGIVPSFVSEQGSDAVYLTVPVSPACETLTEAHSALLRSGDSKDSLVTTLRNAFVNADGASADVREISILDMLKQAVPGKITPESDNVLSLADACLANLLARSLGAPGLDDASLADIRSRIDACRSPGGGWSWFKGMGPSPVITAMMLERLSRMAELDPSIADSFGQSSAVRWLDDNRFENSGRPLWCGALSLEQYLHVRSLYPEVPFKPAVDSKSLKEFRKSVKECLVPRKERGFTGQILPKARRLSTLKNLINLEDGPSLAKSWGIAGSERVRKSCEADVESLVQYAVVHPSGGYYYPNAVMPWRGLLESELYAHTLLCDLISDECISEGIRLWMMVQKETQQWGSDPAYLEALCCVRNAGPVTLDTRVVVLSSDYTRRFADIRPAGNGFTIERVWFREDGSPLSEGDTIHLGEKVRAQYRVHNDENRSFVRLTAPRPALLQPVEQLSGQCGGSFRPMRTSGGWSVSPYGYRSVLSDRSEYWFDCYPEEDTSVSEEFHVSCEGRFSCGVPVMESLYAPHYRANGNAAELTACGDAVPVK